MQCPNCKHVNDPSDVIKCSECQHYYSPTLKAFWITPFNERGDIFVNYRFKVFAKDLDEAIKLVEANCIAVVDYCRQRGYRLGENPHPETDTNYHPQIVNYPPF